jgi:hypothetical protein
VCTLSWAPAGDGYRILFNRDERYARAAAQPPLARCHRGVRVLAPTDGDFGGTWIGVNEAGVAAALLNRYHDGPTDPPRSRVSRGLLVADLLDAGSAAELIERIGDRDLAPYQPFTIAAFGPAESVRLADWDGRHLEGSQATAPGLLRTSSGRDQATAERVRAEAFRRLVPPGREADPAWLRRFHRSHQPERGPFSVCMHRDEAATQSMTEIVVTGSARLIRYRPGSPCANQPVVVRRLRATGSRSSR